MENKGINLSKFEDASKILQEMKENSELAILEEEIKDNKIEFKYKDKTYRVRLLNKFEKEELEDLRCKKFGELIQDKNVLLESDLIKEYKKRDINIEELDKEISKFESEKRSNNLKLGESIANKVGESALKVYRDKINNLKDEITIKLITKSGLLAYSLENRLATYVSKVITYLSLEIDQNGEWIRVFKTYDEFNRCLDENLLGKAGAYSIKLHYNI